MKKIAKVVYDTLGSDFGASRIVDVHVRKELDFDGDEVLRIEVVYDGTYKDVDARRLSSAVRRVRPKLEDMGEMAFPLFSYIAKGDIGAGRLKPA